MDRDINRRRDSEPLLPSLFVLTVYTVSEIGQFLFVVIPIAAASFSRLRVRTEQTFYVHSRYPWIKPTSHDGSLCASVMHEEGVTSRWTVRTRKWGR